MSQLLNQLKIKNPDDEKITKSLAFKFCHPGKTILAIGSIQMIVLNRCWCKIVFYSLVIINWRALSLRLRKIFQKKVPTGVAGRQLQEFLQNYLISQIQKQMINCFSLSTAGVV